MRQSILLELNRTNFKGCCGVLKNNNNLYQKLKKLTAHGSYAKWLAQLLIWPMLWPMLGELNEMIWVVNKKGKSNWDNAYSHPPSSEFNVDWRQTWSWNCAGIYMESSALPRTLRCFRTRVERGQTRLWRQCFILW